MKRTMQFLCRLCVWAFILLPGIVACSSEEEDRKESPWVNLSFRVARLGARSTADDANELMHTLRIVIVDGAGKVEHNELFDFGGTYLSETTEHVYQVKANDTKTIYLLSNTESLGIGETEGMTGEDWAEVVSENCLSEESLPLPLPITAVHTVTVGQENKVLAEPLYVVRAATKFVFQYENETETPIEIGGWELDKVAKKSYLFPHIHQQNWMQTMLTEADKGDTGEGGETPTWITDYDSPATPENHVTAFYTYTSATGAGELSYDPETLPGEGNIPLLVDKEETVGDGKNKVVIDTPIYLHESRFIPLGHDPGAENKQEYALTLSIRKQGEAEYKKYSAVLPYLGSMVRNTLVKVHVVIKKLVEDDDNCIWAEIVPWKEYDWVDGNITPVPDGENNK